MTNIVCNYTEARRKLKSLMEQAVDDRIPITITRRSGDPVVLVAQSVFKAMEETLGTYILEYTDICACILSGSDRRCELPTAPSQTGNVEFHACSAQCSAI